MASELARLTDSYEPDQSAANLAKLTDYTSQGVALDPDGVRRVLITKPNAAPDGMNYVDQPLGTGVNASVGSRVDEILNKLTGANGQQRYQLWPEKVIRGGLSAAGDVLQEGTVNPGLRREDFTDIPAPDMPTKDSTTLGKLLNLAPVAASPQDKLIEQAQEISALAGTGGLAGGLAGGAEGTALNATPSLRPALKYKDKIYKGKEGQQHQDVIPKELYPEFEQMAMNGEDISHYNFGFMNHKGQFLDREKALEYAINEGLVDAHAGQYGALTSTLMADSSKPGTAIEAMAKAKPMESLIAKKNNVQMNADTEVLKNPTQKDFKSLAKEHKSVRTMTDKDGNLYAWAGDTGTHEGIANSLNLKVDNWGHSWDLDKGKLYTDMSTGLKNKGYPDWLKDGM